MGNRNKKIVKIKGQGNGMMDQAIRDIMDVSEEVMNQLEMKRGMMQTVLDTVQEGFDRTGVTVGLRLASDGYDFLFSDMAKYVSSPDDEEDGIDISSIYEDDDDEDDEDLPIEMFGGEDENGTSYSVLVMLAENEDDDDSFDMNIAIVRSSDDQDEILTDDGWVSAPLFE